jgi:phage-related protein
VRQVLFYKTAATKCPVEEFLDALSAKQAKKVTWVLKLLEELAFVPSQYFSKLENTTGIWEVRAQVGGDIFRILCFMDGNNVVVLTNGFQKKTQKTPRQEIDIAEQRKRDYLARKGKS